FDYQTWEGHYGLVKLNLQEKTVRDYLFSVVKYWMKDIGIDGWRLDVAYLIPNDFWREFRKICKEINPECLLVGELIHGPYSKWVDKDLLDAGTEYQVYKSIWSSINSQNMHELKAVLANSYHPQWGHLKDRIMMNFLGNHDTTRIRSILTDDRHLAVAFLILFTLNGFPKIYYGDEIGLKGIKTPQSDTDVRRPMVLPNGDWPSNGKEIFNMINKVIELRQKNHALIYGNLTALYADNETGNILAYLRQSSKQTLLVIINANFETMNTRIPLWNITLENERFKDILNTDDQQEYVVKNDQININNLESCWGKVLEKI
ncbi:MAG: alpha amylase C-terminal domain-containing protein, partial [Candidatus Heimdallarchaeota archaeon]